METELWKEIDKNWGDIKQAIASRLDTTEHIQYDDFGNQSPAGRPMIEDILDAWKHRRRRFFVYCVLAGVVDAQAATAAANEPPGELTVERRGKEIIIGGGSRLNMGYGGKSNVRGENRKISE